MDTTTKRKPTREQILRDRESRRPHFAVTCEVGRVYLDGNGEHTPMEAAMLLIAQHGAPGTFRFPAEHGGFVSVTVDHEEDHHA